jgi:hypothetical protein
MRWKEILNYLFEDNLLEKSTWLSVLSLGGGITNVEITYTPNAEKIGLLINKATFNTLRGEVFRQDVCFWDKCLATHYDFKKAMKLPVETFYELKVQRSSETNIITIYNCSTESNDIVFALPYFRKLEASGVVFDKVIKE